MKLLSLLCCFSLIAVASTHAMTATGEEASHAEPVQQQQQEVSADVAACVLNQLLKRSWISPVDLCLKESFSAAGNEPNLCVDQYLMIIGDTVEQALYRTTKKIQKKFVRDFTNMLKDLIQTIIKKHLLYRDSFLHREISLSSIEALYHDIDLRLDNAVVQFLARRYELTFDKARKDLPARRKSLAQAHDYQEALEAVSEVLHGWWQSLVTLEKYTQTELRSFVLRLQETQKKLRDNGVPVQENEHFSLVQHCVDVSEKAFHQFQQQSTVLRGIKGSVLEAEINAIALRAQACFELEHLRAAATLAVPHVILLMFNDVWKNMRNDFLELLYTTYKVPVKDIILGMLVIRSLKNYDESNILLTP